MKKKRNNKIKFSRWEVVISISGKKLRKLSDHIAFFEDKMVRIRKQFPKTFSITNYWKLH